MTRPPARRPSILACVLLAVTLSGAQARECCDPESPFREGEGYADTPATCETAARWIDEAPDEDERISFVITGEVVSIDWDGALAYLVMCPEDGVQVMCVTYSKEGREVGETVLFAGGYSRVGERRIMLDPCLADPAE